MNSNPSGNDRTLQCLSTYTAPLPQDNKEAHPARPSQPSVFESLSHCPHSLDMITQAPIALFIFIPDLMTYCYAYRGGDRLKVR